MATKSGSVVEGQSSRVLGSKRCLRSTAWDLDGEDRATAPRNHHRSEQRCATRADTAAGLLPVASSVCGRRPPASSTGGRRRPTRFREASRRCHRGPASRRRRGRRPGSQRHRRPAQGGTKRHASGERPRLAPRKSTGKLSFRQSRPLAAFRSNVSRAWSCSALSLYLPGQRHDGSTSASRYSAFAYGQWSRAGWNPIAPVGVWNR